MHAPCHLMPEKNKQLSFYLSRYIAIDKFKQTSGNLLVNAVNGRTCFYLYSTRRFILCYKDKIMYNSTQASQVTRQVLQYENKLIPPFVYCNSYQLLHT